MWNHLKTEINITSYYTFIIIFFAFLLCWRHLQREQTLHFQSFHYYILDKYGLLWYCGCQRFWTKFLIILLSTLWRISLELETRSHLISKMASEFPTIPQQPCFLTKFNNVFFFHYNLKFFLKDYFLKWKPPALTLCYWNFF